MLGVEWGWGTHAGVQVKGKGGLGTAEQREETWLGIKEIGW